jgi:hypothetical protein
MLRSLILFAALGLSIAGAKSYQILLDTPAKIGSMDLKPGTYSVAIMDNSKIRFTDATGKAVEASATIGTAEKKFASTLVDTFKVNGVTQIREIDLGGTKTKIQFE